MNGDQVNLEVLRQAGIITIHAELAKIVLAGKISKKVSVTGLRITKGAKAAIEAAGGSVVDFVDPVRPRKLPKKEASKS